MAPGKSKGQSAWLAACEHSWLRTYPFWCDGYRYLAIECRDCPVSTSLPIGDHFDPRFPPPDSRTPPGAGGGAEEDGLRESVGSGGPDQSTAEHLVAATPEDGHVDPEGVEGAEAEQVPGLTDAHSLARQNRCSE